MRAFPNFVFLFLSGRKDLCVCVGGGGGGGGLGFSMGEPLISPDSQMCFMDWVSSSNTVSNFAIATRK